MNKLPILCVLAAVAAFPQAQTPLTITQSAGSATGELRMQERRTNGQNYVGVKAPQSVASNTVWTLPAADGTNGQCLKTDGAGQWGWQTCGGADVTSYDWSQAPGGSLSVGSNTITLAPCPLGVAASSTYYNIRIAGGTGTDETVRITGGTCTSGASSGTLIFTATSTHSGAWTASSASDGLREAAIALGANGVIRLTAATLTIDPPAPNSPATNVYLDQPLQILGNGYGQYGYSMLNVLGEQWALYAHNQYAFVFRDLYIIGTGTATSGGGMYFAESTTHNCGSIIEKVQFQNLYNGIWFDKQCAAQIRGVRTYNIDNHHLHLENDWATDFGDTLVTDNFFQEDDNEGTCLYWVNGGGVRIIGNKFLGCKVSIDAQFAAASGGASFDSTSIALIIGNSFDGNTEAAIRFDGTIPFDGLVISGNVITPKTLQASFIGIDYGNTGGTTYFDNATISGNAINCRTTTNYTAIKVRRANNTTIDANNIIGCQIGIQAGSTTTNLGIGKNDFGSVTTPYNISMSATMTPNGQIRQISNAFNIWSLAEFTQASGAANSAILFGNPTTGTASQRGLWWGFNDKNLNFARFDSAGSAGPSTDLTIEADGDTYVIHNLGIGVSPTAPLDVVGAVKTTSTVTAGSYLASVMGGKEIRIQGNYSGAVGVGSMTPDPMLMLVDSAERFRFTTSALLPAATDSYTIGSTSARVLGTYSKIFDSVVSGGTGDYVQTRKLQLFDNTGSSTGASYWDLNVVMSGAGAFQNSYFYLRDNAGSNVFKSERIASGSAVSRTTWYTSLLPDTDGGRDIGTPLLNWDKVYANQIGDASYPAVIWGANSDFTGLNTIALTINTGAATVGHVWTATSTGGAGSWQANPTALPVVDTTGIAKGSSDASKIVRFEVDGFTTGTTRVLTPPNTDATIAGLNVTQTFVNPQTVAIASVQNQMTLAQTNSTATYDPACLVLASTDTVTSTIYGAARVCAGYQTASFTNDKFAIQTATGSGTYQDAITITNQAVALPGALTVTGLTTFNGFVDMLGTGINYMYGTLAPQVNDSGSIGTVGSRYGDFFGVRGNFTGATIGSATTTVRLGQNLDLNYSGNYAGMAINTWSATDSHGGVIDFNKSGSGTIGTHSAVVNGETLGFIIFRGSDGTAFRNGVTLNSEVDATVSAGVVPGRLKISTANTSGTMTERMRIDSAGLASFYAGVDITGNLSAAVINATGSPAYRVSGTTVIDGSRNASFVGLTLSGTISSSLRFASGSTYDVGSFGAPALNMYANYVEPITQLVMPSGVRVAGDLAPSSSVTYSLGYAANKWAAAYVTNMYIYGAVQAPSGNLGASSTLSCGSGQAIKAITVDAGIVTAVSCGTP
jgi:hypothetical protein